jgi:cytochrome c
MITPDVGTAKGASTAPYKTRVNHAPYNAVKQLYPILNKDKPMTRTLLALLSIATVSTAALASPELAKKKNCLACHAVDHKVVGPGYKDIAKKYTSADAAAKLAIKIKQGGAGIWGVVPMPANPQVSEAEAKELATWILTLK